MAGPHHLGPIDRDKHARLPSFAHFADATR